MLSTKPEKDHGALQLAIQILKSWEAQVEALEAEVAIASDGNAAVGSAAGAVGEKPS